MNMNPNGTPQTSRWFDQVKAFTEAMGQPVGYNLKRVEEAHEYLQDAVPDDATEQECWDALATQGFTEKDAKEAQDLLELRLNLLSEELEEVAEADTVENLTKELADLLYVTIGFAVTFGLPLCEVFERVHQSNMSKLGEDGKPIYREDGKVLKGPNYQPPQLDDLF
jgi:predicted HAD superfamily Cof-like phosphohydrolase